MQIVFVLMVPLGKKAASASMEIRTKLVLYTAVVSVSITVFLTWWTTDNQLKEIGNAYARRAETLAHGLGLDLEEDLVGLRADRIRPRLVSAQRDADVAAACVLDADKHVVADGTAANPGRAAAPGESTVQRLLESGRPVETEDVLYAVQPVRTAAGRIVGYVIVGVSLAWQKQLAQAAVRNAVILCSVIVLLALGVAALLARSFTRPILALTDMGRRVERGDLSARVSVERQDELGVLTSVFNQMTASRQRAQEDLAAHRQHLEAEIEQRTKELTAINTQLHQEVEQRRQAEEALRNQQEHLEEIVEERTWMLHQQLLERTRAEEGRATSEHQYQTLFNEIADAIFIYDHRTHRFLDCNRAVHRIYGYTLDELRAMTPFDLHPPEEQARVAESINVANPAEPHAYTHLTKDGRRLDVEIASDEITYDGSPAWLSVVRDLTERRQAENALIRAERMAAVGTLVGGIAHEFNNIHAIILWNLELMETRKDIPPEVREMLDVITESSNRATDITKNLLTFCRKEAPVRSRSRLSTVVRDTVRIVQREFESEGISMQLRLDESVTARVDRQQIGQVIMNLLINARHAMLDAEKRELAITIGSRSARAYIRIADTGCGIPQERLPRIFTPFFTTKGEHSQGDTAQSRVKGTGLGLSLCETIIKDHEGEIEVASELGQGTRFTIWLPLTKDESGMMRRYDDEVKSMKGARILVLDDEKNIQRLMRDLLTKREYRVTTTDDGQAALQMIAKDSFDLAIVDLQMPKMSGVEFLEALEEMDLDKRPQILVMTGKQTEDQDRSYAHLTIFDTLRKPCRVNQVYDRVYAALTSRSSEQNPTD